MVKRELYQDYLQRTGMDAAQADVLSRILSDMESRLATKADLRDAKAELKADFAGLRGELKTDVANLRASMTLQFIAMTGFLALVMTLLGVFVR